MKQGNIEVLFTEQFQVSYDTIVDERFVSTKLCYIAVLSTSNFK